MTDDQTTASENGLIVINADLPRNPPLSGRAKLKQATFMSLPIELRLIIYQYAMTTSHLWTAFDMVSYVLGQRSNLMPIFLLLDAKMRGALFHEFLKVNYFDLEKSDMNRCVAGYERRHNLEDSDGLLRCIRYGYFQLFKSMTSIPSLREEYPLISRCKNLRVLVIDIAVYYSLEEIKNGFRREFRREFVKYILETSSCKRIIFMAEGETYIRSARVWRDDGQAVVQELGQGVTIEFMEGPFRDILTAKLL